MPKPLKIKTKDEVILSDGLLVAKRWFNGIKRFFTIKVLPPRR